MCSLTVIRENMIFSNSCMWRNVGWYRSPSGCFCSELSSLEVLDVGCSFSSQKLTLRPWEIQTLSGSRDRSVFWRWACRLAGSSLALAGLGISPDSAGLTSTAWSRLEIGQSGAVRLGGSAGLGWISHVCWAQLIQAGVAQCLALALESLILVLWSVVKPGLSFPC